MAHSNSSAAATEVTVAMTTVAGAAATHTPIPPTPSPLAVASLLGVDLGTMFIVGFCVALRQRARPTSSLAGPTAAARYSRRPSAADVARLTEPSLESAGPIILITAAGMMAAMLPSSAPPPFNNVYLATAISDGALVCMRMNDSGFRVFSRLGGATPARSLQTWTPRSAIVGCTALATTVVLALLLPLR